MRKTKELEITGIEITLEDGSQHALSGDEIGRWMAALFYYEKMQVLKKEYRKQLKTQKLISELFIKLGLVSEKDINWGALPLIALDHILRQSSSKKKRVGVT